MMSFYQLMTSLQARAELQFTEDGGMKVAPPTSEEDHIHFRLLSESVVVFHALESSTE